jgi:hypothetical protein
MIREAFEASGLPSKLLPAYAGGWDAVIRERTARMNPPMQPFQQCEPYQWRGVPHEEAADWKGRKDALALIAYAEVRERPPHNEFGTVLSVIAPAIQELSQGIMIGGVQ